MVKRPKRADRPKADGQHAVMQIRRTRTPNNPPTDLAVGQLGVEMANDPPRLWVGVPATIDPSARRELLASAPATGGWNGEVIGWQLKCISPTKLSLVRHGGGYLKAHGELVLIPPEGFSVGPNSALANQTHYVFYQPQYGRVLATVRAEYATHRPSQWPGNEGVEVVIANEPGGETAESRSLVGIIRYTADGGFIDTPQKRFVRSWLNPRPVALRGWPMQLGTNNIIQGASPSAYLEISGYVNDATHTGGGARLAWVNWQGENVYAQWFCSVLTSAASQSGAQWLRIGLDAINPLPPEPITSPENMNWSVWAGYRMLRSAMTTFGNLSEGFHEARPLWASHGDMTILTPNSGQQTARPRLEGILEGISP